MTMPRSEQRVPGTSRHDESVAMDMGLKIIVLIVVALLVTAT
jgi:hypothetical protein